MGQVSMERVIVAVLIAALAGTPGASEEAEPSWEYQNGRLTYGWPDSDVGHIVIICRGGMADVDIMVRPPHGKAGDKTPITFKNGASEVQHMATLTEVDGLSGDDVEFSIPTSDKLFDLLMRDGPVVAQVPGASLTLPAENGRARAAMEFRKSCVSYSWFFEGQARSGGDFEGTWRLKESHVVMIDGNECTLEIARAGQAMVLAIYHLASCACPSRPSCCGSP
jgi:hypothetical protein